MTANDGLRIGLEIPNVLVDIACGTLLNSAFNERAVSFKGKLNLIGVGCNELEQVLFGLAWVTCFEMRRCQSAKGLSAERLIVP